MRCLIVGGKSSIADEINKTFKEYEYEVINANRNLSDSGINEISFSTDDNNELFIDNLSDLKNLDAVVFCIGKLIGKSIGEYSGKEIDEVFSSNIIVISKFIRVLLQFLNYNASVVFIGSIAGSAGSYDEVYSASKSALYGLTKSLAKNSNRGIRFNCVSPGLIEFSEMYNKFTDSVIDKHRSDTPNGKLLERKALAMIVFDICQPHWTSLNGQIIDINGGRYV